MPSIACSFLPNRCPVAVQVSARWNPPCPTSPRSLSLRSLTRSTLRGARDACSMAKYDAIIIGCGMSGLAAARQLAPFKVAILEARNRLGGRILTADSSMGLKEPVDLGGSMVHGYREGNPVARLITAELGMVSQTSLSSGFLSALERLIRFPLRALRKYTYLKEQRDLSTVPRDRSPKPKRRPSLQLRRRTRSSRNRARLPQPRSQTSSSPNSHTIRDWSRSLGPPKSERASRSRSRVRNSRASSRASRARMGSPSVGTAK
jgi:monoamine oxidase